MWTYVLFLLLVLGGGSAIGLLTGPGEWYGRLAKPSFNPPDWVFGPVWTLLYIFIAVAGARTFRRAPRSTAMIFWVSQLLLNFLWSPVFFRLHSIGGAFVIVLLMLFSIAGFILSVRREDKASAVLFSPYLAWVIFAATLNGALLVLN